MCIRDRVDLHTELAAQTVYDDIEVQLAHTANDGLSLSLIHIYIRGIHLQRTVLTYAAVLFVTDDTLCILYRDLADSLQEGDRRHEDEEQEHHFEDKHDGAAAGGLEARIDLGQQRMGQTCHDADHDYQRDTVTDTLVRDLLAEPHDEHGTRDQDQIGRASCRERVYGLV